MICCAGGDQWASHWRSATRELRGGGIPVTQEGYALSTGWRTHTDFLAQVSGPRYILCNYNPIPRLMTTETLRIRNFAGLTDVELDLKPVTVLIGPQASGKSVCAKLAFFFKGGLRRLTFYIVQESSESNIRKEESRLFASYFPPESWSTGVFEITYKCGPLEIVLRRKNSRSADVVLEYSGYYNELFEIGRAAHREYTESDTLRRFFAIEGVVTSVNQRLSALSAVLTNESYFIPAGRSFFAIFRSSIFSLLSTAAAIDPFLVEFGRFYEQVRTHFSHNANAWEISPIRSRVENLLGGRYVDVEGDEFIQMPDGRQIPVEASSSGQQELLPLVLALANIDGILSAQRTIFVEEPEAHLFPESQREIVHLFAMALDLLSPESSNQYVITTHSPYILSALNNLMYGGKITNDNPEKRDEVLSLLGPDVLVDPEKVGAYSMENGGARFIIDPETKLVEATLIDGVSGDLAREFEQLVSIDFGGETA